LCGLLLIDLLHFLQELAEIYVVELKDEAVGEFGKIEDNARVEFHSPKSLAKHLFHEAGSTTAYLYSATL